jgi:hypothetical protein
MQAEQVLDLLELAAHGCVVEMVAIRISANANFRKQRGPTRQEYPPTGVAPRSWDAVIICASGLLLGNDLSTAIPGRRGRFPLPYLSGSMLFVMEKDSLFGSLNQF